MTVSELRDALAQVEDGSLAVTIDGCDCSDTAAAVFLSGGSVYIARVDTVHLYGDEDVRLG